MFDFKNQFLHPDSIILHPHIFGPSAQPLFVPQVSNTMLVKFSGTTFFYIRND